MKLLILGGSGFLSGTLARTALAAGNDVTVVTRGHRATPLGTRLIVADRRDSDAFALAVGGRQTWDLVVDCIGYDASDAAQDVATFADRCGRFVFISSDFVYDWRHRRVPQNEADAIYADAGYGAGKRAAEVVIENTDPKVLAWTILRPSHIYGPGSLPGCLPLHSRDTRLVARLRSGEPLRLLDGGLSLQHPIFAPDLATCILSGVDDLLSVGCTLNCCGPDVIPSRRYYEILAATLGAPLTIEPVAVETFLGVEPDKAMYCGDRVYDLTRIRATDLALPATDLATGVRTHVESIIDR